MDRSETVKVFEAKAQRIVASYIEENEHLVSELHDNLVMDLNTNHYPYLTVLLLYRAGLHQEAIMFCNSSPIEDVRIFGDEIYQKCQAVYGGRLPQQEIANFISYAQSVAPNQYDICREALIHLMTGCDFVQQSDLLFIHIFENRIIHWLWFHLKLASFQFSENGHHDNQIIDT